MLCCAGAAICCLNDVKDLRVLNIVVAAKSLLGSLGPLFLFLFFFFGGGWGDVVREETLSCETVTVIVNCN